MFITYMNKLYAIFIYIYIFAIKHEQYMKQIMFNSKFQCEENHVYMNYNESNNKYMREVKTNCKSCVGPIKAKFARNKIFEPY